MTRPIAPMKPPIGTMARQRRRGGLRDWLRDWLRNGIRAWLRWWRRGLKRLGWQRLPPSIVALDLETSSLDSATAKILTIAAVRIRDGKVWIGDALDMRVATDSAAAETGIHIHRLRPRDLQDGLPLTDALRQLRAFIGNAAVLGYYLHFDISVLNRALAAQGLPTLRNRRLELSYVYQRRWHHRHPTTPADLQFETMAANLAVPVLHRHTALGDATTTALMWLALKAGKTL